MEDALAWLEKGGLDGSCGHTVPLPTTFEDYEGGKEATHTVAAHLNYPPYPWLDEARLGMEMGRYFDRVELTDWTEPTETKAGSHTFRFYRSDADRTMPLTEVDVDDMTH